MFTPPSASARYRALQAVLMAGLPLAVIACFVGLQANSGDRTTDAPTANPPSYNSTPAKERVVVVAVDGLAGVMARDAETMPTLARLADDSLHGPLNGCRAAKPLPCLLTALEGERVRLSSND